MVTVRQLRWPPCPYMVKTLKNFLQNQESFETESRYIASGTRFIKFVQMMIVGLPLTFLQQGQNCIPIHLYGEDVEKSFSQIVLKTNG